MRLNQQEENLFNELENIEFDFSLDDDISDLNKNDKEKILKEINELEDINNQNTDEQEKPNK